MSALLVLLMLIARIIQSQKDKQPIAESREFDNGYNSGDPNECENECTDGVIMPKFCEYVSDLWDDPSIPLDERNNIGMAKYLTSSHILKATQLAKQGKVYKLSYKLTNSMPISGNRVWFTTLKFPTGTNNEAAQYYVFEDEYTNDNKICGTGLGGLDQRLMTAAHGNSGTQFDGIGHIFFMNGKYGDINNYLFHNGFKGNDILETDKIKYLGVDNLPPFITRAILLDIAGYIGQDPLPNEFKINSNIINDVLNAQGMNNEDYIETGDVILIYTGWANAYWFDDDKSIYYNSGAPGITLDTIINIFGPKKVLMIGGDNWGVEYKEKEDLEHDNNLCHAHWIVCHGGFFFENLKLIEWVTDARNGDVPYEGGFYFAPAQIEGAPASLGTPMVIV